MRRPGFSVVTILAVALLGASPGDVMAQDDARQLVGIGGRVEVPEAGFAITLPVGWSYFRMLAKGTEAALSPFVTAHPDQADNVRAVRSRMDENRNPVPLMSYGRTRGLEACQVASFDTDGKVLEAIAADAFAEATDAIARNSSTDLQTDLMREDVELPIGDAVRIDFRIGRESEAYRVHDAVWFFVDDETAYYLRCVGDLAPDGRWQSIAESLEILPAGAATDDAETLANVEVAPMPRHIERPEDGYAITFPDGWGVRDVTDELYRELDRPGPLEGEKPYLLAESTFHRVDCELVDLGELAAIEGFASLDDVIELFVYPADEVRYLETEAGRVLAISRVTGGDAMDSSFFFHEADRWVHLDCLTFAPQEALPTIAETLTEIAESFVFLPAGQS